MGRVTLHTLPETGQGKKEENVCNLARAGTPDSGRSLKDALSRVRRLRKRLLLLRLAFFGSSAPNAQVGPDGNDHQDNFEDIQAMRGDERVGQGCPGHEEKAEQRHEGISKGGGDAVTRQPHEEKCSTGSKCEGDKDPTAHNPISPLSDVGAICPIF
jgi:hypothetical protein